MINRLYSSGNSILRPGTKIDWPSRSGDQIDRKSLGEPIPQLADISRFPELIALFSPQGMLDRIRRKLIALSQKKGVIIPAKGTIAMAHPAAEDESGTVYVGVEFALQHQSQEPVVAGVLAHEWGHLLSDELLISDFAGLTWDELWELRREEEAAADAYSGKALHLLRYPVEPMAEFLLKSQGKIETHKYHPVELRARIIREAYALEVRRKALLEKFFARSVYPNPFQQPLVSIG